MRVTWSEVQERRLRELAADESQVSAEFGSTQERDRAFQQLARTLVERSRRCLQEVREKHLRPALCRLESLLVECLVRAGFVQVATPTILSRGLLKKMSIDENHPLAAQVFWLDKDRCLRPMLAPHLYYILKDLLRLWPKPVRIFEVGSCFRKDTRGAAHTVEFTMLNLVEMGLAQEKREQRLAELADLVTGAAGLDGYSLQKERSAVYGETIDLLAGADRIEVGSAALGPHALDRAWQISEPWVGIGFGLERLLMVREKGGSAARFGRSLAYLDGVRLNV